MLRPEDLICPRPEGLYCPPGDFYIDPVRPVDRAVITHGHADHARAGHGVVIATPQTLDIMHERYGADFAGRREALAYGERTSRNGVEVMLAPAGHVLGSAQVVVRWKGMTVVASGDYKRRRDPTCPPFEPIACDVFITEATFGLPVFRHPDASEEAAKLLRSVAQFPERAHLVGAYALGKAQRIICLLREAGYDETIYVHGALDRLDRLYERHGVGLGPLAPATAEGAKKGDFAGRIIVAPPSSLNDRWARRFPDPVTAFASGWMRVRARAHQRGVELPLIVSDHADWDELTATVDEIRPAELWITHGREEALERWANLRGIPRPSPRPHRIRGGRGCGRVAGGGARLAEVETRLVADVRNLVGGVGLGDLPGEADAAAVRDPDLRVFRLEPDQGQIRIILAVGKPGAGDGIPELADFLAVVIFGQGSADAGLKLLVLGHQAEHGRMAASAFLDQVVVALGVEPDQTLVAIGEGGHRLKMPRLAAGEAEHAEAGAVDLFPKADFKFGAVEVV